MFQLTGKSYTLWGDTDLSPEAWYHVAATYDGATMKLYINGVQDPTELERIGNIDHADAPLRIGHGSQWVGTDTSYPFKGKIDEVRIYDRALSQREIRKQYLKGAPSNILIDIRPRSCPNVINLFSRRVLPVTILGTEDLDVRDIALSSIGLSRDGSTRRVRPIEKSFNYQDFSKLIVVSALHLASRCRENVEEISGPLRDLSDFTVTHSKEVLFRYFEIVELSKA